MPLFNKDELDAIGLLRSPKVHAVRSTASISRSSSLKILNALADYGTLKTEALAALCFPASKYSQGLQMAQRKLKELSAAKLAIPRIDAHGVRSWILSGRGASMVGAHDGWELNPGGCHYGHTCLGARYLIHKRISEGYTCYSEYAFTHDRCPFQTRDLLAALGKIPDGILLAGSGGKDAPHRLYALETEVAIKSESKILKNLSTLAQLGKKIRSDLPYVFAGLIVLFPAEMEWHAARLASAARRRWQQCANPQGLADHVLIARAELGAAWAFKGVRETKLQL